MVPVGARPRAAGPAPRSRATGPAPRSRAAGPPPVRRRNRGQGLPEGGRGGTGRQRRPGVHQGRVGLAGGPPAGMGAGASSPDESPRPSKDHSTGAIGTPAAANTTGGAPWRPTPSPGPSRSAKRRRADSPRGGLRAVRGAPRRAAHRRFGFRVGYLILRRRSPQRVATIPAPAVGGRERRPRPVPSRSGPGGRRGQPLSAGGVETPHPFSSTRTSSARDANVPAEARRFRTSGRGSTARR
jgi:hypothetical protein